MADPLSIAASVGGLVLLGRDVVKLIVSVTGTVRGATSQLQELRQSVALLCGYLESLSLIIDDDDDTPAPMSILACNQTLEKIRLMLEKFGPNSIALSATSSALPTKHGAWQDVKQKVRWVIDKDEAEKLLADLEKHKSTLSLALSKKSLGSIIEVLTKQDETLQHIEQIRKEQSQIRQQQIQDTERRLSRERRKMLNAVSDMRPEDTFKKHFSLHQDGTGVWFLESPEFEKFMNTQNSRLWLYGIPGAGKSVLSATIIDHISTQRTEHCALAYFFCEYFNAATQTCRSILGSIARQLALQNPRALGTLEEFFNDQTDLGQLDFNPEDDDLFTLIGQMSTTFDSVIIVIDGLDECQENRAAVVESLAQLSRHGVGSIKSLFASRRESDIDGRLASFDTLAIAASKADVRLYVAAQLKSRFRRMCEKDPALSEQILTVLVDKSEGMFQWVRCQIDCLENVASNKQRRKALEDLPRDLHGTYERILLRAINSSEDATIQFVERTLRWIALATTPLSVAAISHAISVEVEERSFDDSLDMRIILALCSSLVREVDGNLAFSHFSVKEYLMQISPQQGQVARFRIRNSDHSLLAQTCLTYLLLDDFDRQGYVTPADLNPVKDKREADGWTENLYPRYPFYNYAALRWTAHAKACGVDNEILSLMGDLFNPQKTDHFLFWAHLRLMDMLPYSTAVGLCNTMHDITPLHLACIFRFTDLVDMLLYNGAKANAFSAVLGSPLQCVISVWQHGDGWSPDDEDRYETVRRLLDEPISKDQIRNDPLADALGCGDEEMASILLEHGFTLTTSAVAKWPSTTAPKFLSRLDSKDLDEEVGRSLREKFGDLDFLRSSQSAQDSAHRTEPLPFHFATVYEYIELFRESCSYGRFEHVKNLVPFLKNNLTGDYLSDLLSQSLVEAAAHGHADVVQFLVEAGANPSFQRHSDGRTALHEASNGFHANVVRILLEINDDNTAISGIKDNDGLTPWMCAIQAGSFAALQLFLTNPSTVNLQTAAKNGQTAAHLAARTCNEKMVSFLKEHGFDFACLDDSGAAPIHALLESHYDLFYEAEDCESFIRTFRYLHRSDILRAQRQSGQTLLHMIARLPPIRGKLLCQAIRDNQIFGDTPGHSFTVRDSEGNIPLHLLVQRLATYLKEFMCYGSLLPEFVEFIRLLSLLSTDNGDASEQDNMKNKSGRTPAMELVRSIEDIEVPETEMQTISDHLLEVFRSLRDVGKGRCSFEETDNEKRTILHYIARCKSNFPFKEITGCILESSIDVGAKSSSGECALMLAARGSEENVDFMRLLIPRMSLSQLEEEDSSGFTILHYICKTEKAEIQKVLDEYLLQPIAKSEKRDWDGRIPLSHAPSIVTDDAITSRLIQLAGKTVDICDEDGKNCMYWSCELGSIPMVSALLDAGANIDAPLGPEYAMGAERNPPLLIAALSKQLDMVEFLLDKGANPLVKGQGCWQLHHFALIPGRNELLSILENLTEFDFNAKADVWRTLGSSEGAIRSLIQDATPLHIATDNGNEQGLQWLLSHNKVSDVNVETRDGSTPLILASLCGHRNVCKTLIDLGCLISKTRHDGCTALHAACHYGHLEVCKLLIVTDNDCVFQNFREQTPLQIAAGGGHKKIVELLLEHEAHVTVGAEINARKAGHHDIAELLRRRLSIGHQDSPKERNIELDFMRLKAACQASNESTLVEVLQNDINPNIRLSHTHETPLHIACSWGWKEAVKLLVKRNADMEALDRSGQSPLKVAVVCKQQGCTELLYGKGALATTRGTTGSTVLHEAAWQNDSVSLSYFLEKGVEANVKMYRGHTPLHLTSDPGCVAVLLEYGADPFELAIDNEALAWTYSHCKNGVELLKKVFDKQPKEKVQQNVETFCLGSSSTPLYNAAFLGSSDVASTLLEYGAKVNGRCGPFGAPVHAALKQGHTEVATMLLENGARPYRVVRDGEEHAAWFWEYGYQFCMQGQDSVWMSGSL